ncbi:MAG: class I SAM-dependent methyltransferase [Pseudomonadota bacterium]
MTVTSETTARNDSRRLRLFYAEQSPTLYDQTTHLTMPDYGLAHNSLCDLVYRHARQDGQDSALIVDIGCGTGAEAMRLLYKLPRARIIAVDRSDSMLRGLERKLQEDPSLAKRCHLVAADALSDGFDLHEIMAGSPWEETVLDIAVSAFALHHHGLKLKRKLYEKILVSLRPHGVFLNLDIQGFQAKSLNSMAQAVTEEWIRESFEKLAATDAAAISSAGVAAEELGAEWIAHVSEQNLPLPIEPPAWASSVGNTSVDFEGEADTIRRIGFSEVACPYRMYQTAILWARR